MFNTYTHTTTQWDLFEPGADEPAEPTPPEYGGKEWRLVTVLLLEKKKELYAIGYWEKQIG